MTRCPYDRRSFFENFFRNLRTLDKGWQVSFPPFFKKKSALMGAYLSLTSHPYLGRYVLKWALVWIRVREG